MSQRSHTGKFHAASNQRMSEHQKMITKLAVVMDIFRHYFIMPRAKLAFKFALHGLSLVCP